MMNVWNIHEWGVVYGSAVQMFMRISGTGIKAWANKDISFYF